MRLAHPRRLLLLALALAIVLGLLFGWYARPWTGEAPDARLRHAAEQLRTRVHALTH